MQTLEHPTIYRNEYNPSPYNVDEVFLDFQLDPEKTLVTAKSKFRVNPNCKNGTKNLRLDGENLTLIEIVLNEKRLEKSQYSLEEKGLVLFNPPNEFVLKITTEINPQENSALSGLYRTSNNYCTQCEAEGFRRITYYLDRPDVLALFTTRIEANMEICPVLLANGNPVEQGKIDGDRHYAIWHDPYPKPCYLFALVAGDLCCVEDTFYTQSGKEVALKIFVEHRNKDKCRHAMRSLQKAMEWDEKVYNLEYDLDIYMIVAVDDFNMGAMENKGLNIFNSKYVLASPESATDQDYLGIEGVIAHEYFHNWTGNRITCRDWFQLSLKEGLTVFRDQEFSADMNSRAVKRITDVRVLRNYQFREDAGPMAHPVRPDSYVEINNFYTVTVYNKGAEVVRMLHHILGHDTFMKGMALYFERFDGMAVTCDDFVQSMSDASGIDLEHFKLWYSQSGTPVLTLEECWNPNKNEYRLNVTQNCKATPGQTEKKPFHIPIDLGLLSPQNGGDLSSKENSIEKKYRLEIKEKSHEYIFSDYSEKPVLSFLRSFTAPVKVEHVQTREELAFLMVNDTDLFNRWEAANRLSIDIVQDVMKERRKNRVPVVDENFIRAFRHNLQEEGDKALIAQALTLPSEAYLAQQMDVIEPDLLHDAVLFIKKSISISLQEELREVYSENLDQKGYAITPESMGRRSLKNCCLSYLMTPGATDNSSLTLCLDQFYQKKNMTDVIAALAALSNYHGLEREEAFNSFYEDWNTESLVIDKWFQLQAVSDLDSTLTRVKNLLSHKSFSLKNPNKVRSLIGAFCTLNHARFHEQTGSGYRFLAEQVLKIDKFNPQIAARLVTAFSSYRAYSQKLKMMMQEQLQFVLMQKNISSDVYEIVKKSLQTDA